jgi:hypothetical protein
MDFRMSSLPAGTIIGVREPKSLTRSFLPAQGAKCAVKISLQRCYENLAAANFLRQSIKAF